MHFPDNPFILFLYWFLNTPGIGALVVAFLGGGMLLGFASVLRWIANGGKANESAVYTYPTEALHDHEA